MKSPSNDRWVSYLVAATVAALVFLFGLQRFGIWQPAEVHVADLARELIAGNPVQLDRPSGQVSVVAAGFRAGSVSELWGRLPGALIALVAFGALMTAARALGDRRLAVYAGVAYATLPVVFMNARMMITSGLAQSATTLGLSGLALMLWGREQRWHIAGAVFSVLGLALGTGGAGVMLGLVPVVGAAGITVALRFAGESRRARTLGAVCFVAGAALAGVSLWVASRELTGYSVWVGASQLNQSPAQWQTFEVYLEHLAHATFPWTGLVPFGLLRLASPPSRVTEASRGLLDDDELAALDPWREAGFRTMAFVAIALGFALQTFHMQIYGMTPFVVVGPVALGVGVLLRDAEREMKPWRTVTVAALLFTALMLRDFMQFPKTSYAALGLPDGGPTFPSGFSTKFSQWLQDVKAARAVGGEIPPLPAEGYFLLETGMFVVLGLLGLFQGAGEVATLTFDRPMKWLLDMEREGRDMVARDREDFGRAAVGSHLLAHLRVTLSGLAVLLVLVGLVVPRLPGVARQLTTPGRNAMWGLTLSPLLVVAGVFGFIVVWNVYAWLGRAESPVTKLLGTRVAMIPVAAVGVALVMTQGFIPALSEHMSPRGVWAVVRALRHGNERVGRYGGPSEDPASRYYTNVQPELVTSEDEAVAWLTAPDRRFLVVGSDVFGGLNRSYRRVRRTNVPVADSSNSNLLLAVSDLEGRPSRNPLDPWVLSTRPNLRHPAREPVRLDDVVEYIGYELDSHGMSYVPVGGSFDITFVFHVIGESQRNWQVFVHVDGPGGPRINGDHEPVERGKYPVRLWQPGDYIRDKITVAIPVTYRPGIYTVFMGFFDGGDRMRTEGGEHDRENRIIAARIRVQ
jgi:4-amino-4-deoxy-L-arabinose transferase-like glycosyltransferase